MKKSFLLWCILGFSFPSENRRIHTIGNFKIFMNIYYRFLCGYLWFFIHICVKAKRRKRTNSTRSEMWIFYKRLSHLSFNVIFCSFFSPASWGNWGSIHWISLSNEKINSVIRSEGTPGYSFSLMRLYTHQRRRLSEFNLLRQNCCIKYLYQDIGPRNTISFIVSLF